MIVNFLTAAGQQKIWKQERFILFGQSAQEMSAPVIIWTNLHGSNGDPIATYIPAADYSVYIDMTDYVRTYPSVSYIYVSGNGFENPITVSVSVVGLISPDSVFIPYNPLVGGLTNLEVAPPTFMYRSWNTPVQIEIRSKVSWNIKIYDGDGDYLWNGTTNQPAMSMQDPSAVSFEIARSSSWTKFLLRELRCDVEYAIVRWVSFTGATRIHVFECKKHTTEAVDSFSVMPLDNEYHEAKGRRDGFVLALQGLNQYDFWYYSDVITSSKVEVSFGNNTFERVQVTSKSVTIPDGNGGSGKLEINVNWKRYDSIDL